MSKKKALLHAEDLATSLSSMLVPAYILKDFAIYSAKESSDYWTLELREKEDRIPVELSSFSDIVLDGYCNPIEIQSAAFILKPVYLKCYRRRWKRSNQDEHYSNDYTLHRPKVKVVEEMTHFFKS